MRGSAESAAGVPSACTAIKSHLEIAAKEAADWYRQWLVDPR